MKFENYFQKRITETQTEKVYASITKLESTEHETKYMLEVLFKFTHVYKRAFYTNLQEAYNLYNFVTFVKE